MAFVGREQVMDTIERLVKHIWNKIIPESVDESQPFLRMTYQDAMQKVLVRRPY